MDGRTVDFAVRGRGLGRDVSIRLWSPLGTRACDALPLLVVLDGREYDRQASVLARSAVAIVRGALPPHRVALLDIGPRDEWYSASAVYARVLCTQVIPALAQTAPTRGAPAGLGASLGGLALAHASFLRPACLAGLILQSASFFTPRYDGHESGFRRYGRIVRFVRRVQREPAAAAAPPLLMTCGRDEENLANNRLMARALAERGHDVAFHEVPGGHDYRAWRGALESHEIAFLAWLWSS